MENPNFKVLLLGWDETTPVNESEQPGSLPLIEALVSQATLTAILPHLPAEASNFPQARITGLDGLTAADLAAMTTLRVAGAWQAPAAPYRGASPSDSVSYLPNPQGTTAPSGLSIEANGSAASGYTLQKSPPDLFLPDEQTADDAEPGPAEAHDLNQPADNLTPDEPAPAASSNLPPVEFSPERATLNNLFSNLSEAPSDLNFQVIQYTRFATRLALREDFGVIYAPEWPVWLAGLEIRQLTGRPLVLHVHSLALDRNTPDDRGWILELERLALRRATLVLAASEALAQRLSDAYEVAAERIQVVPAHDDAALTNALRTTGLAS